MTKTQAIKKAISEVREIGAGQYEEWSEEHNAYWVCNFYPFPDRLERTRAIRDLRARHAVRLMTGVSFDDIYFYTAQEYPKEYEGKLSEVVDDMLKRIETHMPIK